MPPLEAWTLAFDSSFAIENLWNGRVLENDGKSYTVASQSWTNPIQPNASATIGFTGTKSTDADVFLDNFTLTAVAIGEGNPVAPIDPPMGNINITATANYNEDDGNITISWLSDKAYGIFDILMSEDGKSFTSIGTVTDENSFIYQPNEFEKLYFKVVQMVDNKAFESNIISVNSINWDDETDTDNDGLTDVYEKYYFATDPNNADTDGDGLPDGYEVYYLGTDPKEADSDNNSISDGDEDFDKDGLTNLNEYELETDPNNSDSDGDGLSDSDEVNKYKTNPLKYDTDGDKVSDGDEITLGLNPNSGSTDGIPDSERTFAQQLNTNSSCFSEINTNENPFKISLEIKSAGVIENNLSVQESGYSNAMNNDAILGTSPEFAYTDGLKVEDIIINFDVDSSVTANINGKYTTISDEFVGIKRLNVFKYFEDTNMLLPIETFHDVENNRVYTHVDELGTYCLMDMEIWLDSLGIEAVDSNYNKVAVAQSYALASEVNTRPTDVVLMLQTAGSHNENDYVQMKKATELTAQYLFENMSDVRISLILCGEKVTNPTTSSGSKWANDNSEFGELLADAEYKQITGYTMMGSAFTSAENRKDYRDGANRFVALFRFSYYYQMVRDTPFTTLNAEKSLYTNPLFNYSIINYGGWYYTKDNNSPIEMEYHKEKLAEFESYGGKHINGLTSPTKMSESIGEHIVEFNPSLPENYTIITAHNLGKLPSDFGKITPTSIKDYDNDGLSDSKEINFNLISYKNGNYVLPTFGEAMAMTNKPYVETAMMRYLLGGNVGLLGLMNTLLLPVKSDPLSVDGDGDGYWDSINNKLSKSIYTIADSQPLKFNKSSKTPFTYIPVKRTYESNVSDQLNYYHQKYLYFLASEYDNQKRNYFRNQGYEIDGYLLIGVLVGESGAGIDSMNYIGALESLESTSTQNAKRRMESALLSSGIVSDKFQMEEVILNDNFYFDTACILSYWDNTYINTDKPRLDWNHTSLIQANPNVARWRDGIDSLSNTENMYEYRCYDFEKMQGKYATPFYPYEYCYDEYVNVNSLYYETAYYAINEYEKKYNRNFWTRRTI